MTHKFKLVVATSLFCLALGCMTASVLWAEGIKPGTLTNQQRKDLNKCIAKYCEDVAKCLRDHPTISPSDCQKAAYKGYEVCKSTHGIPRTQYPAPKFPDYGPSKGDKGDASGVKPPDSGKQPPKQVPADVASPSKTKS